MSNQSSKTHEVKMFCGRPQLTEYDRDSRPSWKKYGTGVSSIEIVLEPNGSLYIIAEETAFEDGKAGHSKKVFVTLSAEASAKLLEMMNARAAAK